MKGFNIILMVLLLFFGCGRGEKKANTPGKADIGQEYVSAGAEIDALNAMNAKEMLGIYDDLAVKDTLAAKFEATVTEVCQAKGCWMKMRLNEGQEVMVRFKDYGFFVPKDIAGKEVIVNGQAFVEAMGVEDQQHFAEDAGKSPEEIAAITKPKKTYSFEADGVLIPQ